MRPIHTATISTAIVISLGILMILPFYFPLSKPSQQNVIMLSFSIVNDSKAYEWCNGLSSVLVKHNVKATVFVTGKVAEECPECVKAFTKDVDFGSQTYSYVDIKSITDYSAQLDEIMKGKQALDKAGSIYSRVFRAPYGSTDENIYSLLTRSDIIADFSYNYQYNKYFEGQFIRFDLVAFEGTEIPWNLLKEGANGTVFLIRFNSSTPVEQIDEVISRLMKNDALFLNASELTGLDLTVRDDNH